MRLKSLYTGGLVGLMLVIGFIAVNVAAWVQHLYTCFTTESWGFLVAGAIFFPIGVIHGWGIWFGLW